MLSNMHQFRLFCMTWKMQYMKKNHQICFYMHQMCIKYAQNEHLQYPYIVKFRDSEFESEKIQKYA